MKAVETIEGRVVLAKV